MVSVLVLAAVLASSMPAQADHGNDPTEPIKLADDLYYVGSSDIASYLITTPAGAILIDAGYESTVPIISHNVEQLGFRLSDVRILLNTQAHFDHAEGFAALKKLTGARLIASDADARLLEAGGRGDYLFADRHTFAPVKVDQRIGDGGRVALGGKTLTAHLTPGHTPGCTTWTFDVTDRGRTLAVVIVGGATINPGTHVSGMATYPQIARDYAHTFDVLESLRCDLFLGAHMAYFDGAQKAQRLRSNPGSDNPFVDPEGYRQAVRRWKAAFTNQLAAERARP